MDRVRKSLSGYSRSSGIGASNSTLNQSSFNKIKDALKGGKGSKKLRNELVSSGLPEAEGTALLICDPQIDFHQGGAVPAVKADENSLKIAQLIKVFGARIDEIYVTLQIRPYYHIAHPIFWQDQHGKEPEPFVHISITDIENGNYISVRKEHRAWTKQYFDLMKKKDLHNLVVFPPHCVVGTKGAAVVDSIADALKDWEQKTKKSVRYIVKGTNSRTEQFSCFQGVVQVKDDDSTALNTKLLSKLHANDKLIVCGHTLSHSVKHTVEDLLQHIKNGGFRMYLLHDCCSSLRDFHNSAQHFVEEMRKEDNIIVSNYSNVTNIFEDTAVYDDINATHNTLALANTSDYFNVEAGTLGEGCYLMYNDKNYGSLFVVWSKGKGEEDRLRSCLGFFKAGAGTRVPDFKFRNEGKNEIVTEISKAGMGRRKKLYQGILNFVYECKKFKGLFVFQTAANEELMDFGLYALDNDNNIIVVESEQFSDPTNFAVVSCIPKAANAYRGVTKQEKQMFIQTGESLGATLELK